MDIHTDGLPYQSAKPRYQVRRGAGICVPQKCRVRRRAAADDLAEVVDIVGCAGAQVAHTGVCGPKERVSIPAGLVGIAKP